MRQFGWLSGFCSWAHENRDWPSLFWSFLSVCRVQLGLTSVYGTLRNKYSVLLFLDSGWRCQPRLLSFYVRRGLLKYLFQTLPGKVYATN